MEKCPKCKGDITGIEVLGWYDGISHRYCPNCAQKYSRVSHIPIYRDELCRYGSIYKVRENGEFEYTIISSRKDI